MGNLIVPRLQYKYNINRLLFELSGFLHENMDPIIDTIDVYFVNKSLDGSFGEKKGNMPSEQLSLLQLFQRYPPFEPLPYPYYDIGTHKKIRGLSVWIPRTFTKNN